LDFLTISGETLTSSDNGTVLSFIKENGTPVTVSTKYDSLPFAFADGCLQFIDGIIE
jgi:hypothetical protein